MSLTKKKYACLGVNIKKKDGRGVGDDPQEIVTAMEDVWEEMKEKLSENGDLSDDLRKTFNANWPGEDDLGDILFGDYADFQSRIKYLDDETQQAYTDHLFQTGVIDFDSKTS